LEIAEIQIKSPFSSKTPEEAGDILNLKKSSINAF